MYSEKLSEERKEVYEFFRITSESGIRKLHLSDCAEKLETAHISAKKFASIFDIPYNLRRYLKRYFD